jgi:putative hydroxymethylpyrimidine transport system permease protein
MFAALTVLSAVSLLLYFFIDFTMEKLIFWEKIQGIRP